MEQKTRGGARTNAGRKPSANPKTAFTLYIEKSIISNYGGQKELREFIYKTIKTKQHDSITSNSVQEQQVEHSS
jgi:hypothetical protein